MSRSYRRLLPPLAVAGILAVVVWRAAAEPSREPAREAIRARWESVSTPVEVDETVGLLTDYQRKYATREDRFFVAHAWLRLRMPARAVRALWGRVEQEVPREDARRFAEMALLALGWKDEARTWPDESMPHAILTFAEAGASWALDWLDRWPRERSLEETTRLYMLAFRHRVRPAMDALVRSMRERGERRYGVAAAMASLGPDPYPEREADIDLLLEVVLGPERHDRPNVWNVSCLGLGRSEEPRALAALRELAATFAASRRPEDQGGLLQVQVALLQSGDWSMEPAIAALVHDPEREHDPLTQRVLAWYLDAVLHRQSRGDPEAQRRVGELWSSREGTRALMRERIAETLLLHREMPGPEVPVERILADLTAYGAPVSHQVLAAAFAVRRGDPGARERLLRLLATGAELPPMVGPAIPDLSRAPLLTGLRALYLYD